MKIQIIVGSTRQGRVTDRLAKWVAAEVRNVEGNEVEIVDLADYNLEFFNEPVSPRYNPNRQPEGVTKQWLDKLAEADAFVFVTPEYNHAITGALKNALDYVDTQLTHKAAAIVSHGSVGGARAAENLKLILLEAGSIVVPQAVAFVGMLAMNPTIDENGVLDAEIAANPYGPQTSLKNTTAELVWLAGALQTA